LEKRQLENHSFHIIRLVVRSNPDCIRYAFHIRKNHELMKHIIEMNYRAESFLYAEGGKNVYPQEYVDWEI